MTQPVKESIYSLLGVDANKSSVRAAFSPIIENEYPGAFVNIITDPYCDKRALTQHQDGDGSKFVQRLLHYLENGDPSVFMGMVDDALSMNTGDIAASGFVFGPWLLTDVINSGMDKDLKAIVMKAVAERFSQLFQIYRQKGFELHFLGGETADLKYQVKSGVFDVAITAWEEKENLIKGNVKPGDAIFGFHSDGRAAWEDKINSGIMSNYLTMARSSLMSKIYNKLYPQLRMDKPFYNGRFLYDQRHVSFPELTVGESILSPTRQWAIVIKEIVKSLKKRKIFSSLHGISMNTGGGATKIKHVGEFITYNKSMPTPPPIFQLIKQESGEDWANIYCEANCGIGIDVVGEDNKLFAEALEEAAVNCEISLSRLGYCEDSTEKDNVVLIDTPFGSWGY